MRLLALVSACVFGCGTAPEVNTAAGAAGCPPAPTASSPPLSALRSTASLEVTFAQRGLEELLGEWLPTRVAQGKSVPAGAAGRATFAVDRGTLEIGTHNNGIEVRVPLNGDIRLCKPIGPVCLEYGRCQPKWTAKARFETPWLLSEEPLIDLDLEVVKGCVLSPVKVDATSELVKVTDSELAKLRKQLRKQVRRSHQAWLRQLQDPLKHERKTAPLELEAVVVGISNAEGEYTLSTQWIGKGPSGVARSGAAPAVERHSVADGASWSSLLTPNTRLTTSTTPLPPELLVEQAIALEALARDYQTRFPEGELKLESAGNAVVASTSPFEGCAVGWASLTPRWVDDGLVMGATRGSHPTLVSRFDAAPPQGALASVFDVKASLSRTREPWLVRSDLIPRVLRLDFVSLPDPVRSVEVRQGALVLVDRAPEPLRAKLTLSQ